MKFRKAVLVVAAAMLPVMIALAGYNIGRLLYDLVH
jgi:hypothetical protein